MEKKRKRKLNKKILKPAGLIDQMAKRAEEVKKEASIVDVFHYYGSTLKAVTENEYKGSCIFHDDKEDLLTANEKELSFKCPGCGKEGNIFHIVQEKEGVEFPQAVSWLEEFNSQEITGEPLLEVEDIERNLTFLLPADQQEEETGTDQKDIIDKQQLFQAVMKLYHADLMDKTAQDYLKKRGLVSREKHSFFQTGYCSGKKLTDKMSESQKEVLITAGLLKRNGDIVLETFTDCLVFPIYDELDNIIYFYGRSLNPATETPHINLKGKRKGIFNRKASKVYPDQLVLTKSIIDAVSLAEMGLNNVQACYGEKGYTDEMQRIHKSDLVREIVIAFGHEEADKLKKKLVDAGFTVRSIMPEKVKDWNEALLAGVTADEVKGLIEKAEVHRLEEEDNFKAVYENGFYFFTIDDLNYRLPGIKNIFVNSLKLHIKIQIDEDTFHHDKIDLHAYKSRVGFSHDTAMKLNVNAVKVEKDLDKILNYLEKENVKMLSGEKDKKKQLTEQEVKQGIAFLKSKTLIDDTIKDITRLGYAGEDNNKLIVYMIGLSRFLPKPLSGFVLSTPGSGKSYLVDTVLKLFPQEVIKHNSSLSDQAFHYMSSEDFDGNIFIMGESLHNPTIEGYIRQMQTENMLSRAVVKKDEKTGEMTTVTISHKVRLVFMTTSTKLDINLENVSRCLLLKIDESKNQTNIVLEKQRDSEGWDKQIEQTHIIPAVIKKHRIAQQLLKRVRIFNPFAKYIRFPSHLSIFRRSQPHFLILIKTICYYRQYQKKKVTKMNTYTKQSDEWITCDLYDYEVARKLFIECKLLSEMDEIPEKMVFLYDKIRDMVKKKAKKENVSPVEIDFIQSQIRTIEGLDMGRDSVKKYVKRLVDFEYLQIVGGKRHGTKFSYKLREDKPINKIDASSIIPTVEEMKKLVKVSKK